MQRPAFAAAMLALVSLAVSQPAAQQKAAKHRPTTAFVLGRVIDAETNRPIADATVTIGARGGGRGQISPSSRLTTSTGYFLFRDLPAGAYPLTAHAPAYLPGGFGQRRLDGPTQPLSLAQDQRITDVVIRLWREATLSGVVRDDAGDPVAGITVTLIDRSKLDASPLRTSGAPTTPLTGIARTDSAGMYRFSGLHPGEFVVSVSSRIVQIPARFADADRAALDLARSSGISALASGLRGVGPTVRVRDMLVQTSGEGSWGGSNALTGLLPLSLRADGVLVGYPSAFFPEASSPMQATPIRLAAGDDRRGVDLRLQPIALRRVTGRVESPAGAMSGVAVHLIPRFASGSTLERTHETAVTLTNGGGAFEFLGVPPGEYVLKSWRLPQASVIGTDALQAESTLWSSQPITVGERPLDNIVVMLRAGSAILGRVVLDGAAPPLPAARLQTMVSVAFEPPWPLAFGARLAVRVNAALDFATHGLPSGEYFPVLPNQFAPAAGWFFEAATREGRDLMLSPIVLEPGSDATGVVLTFADRRTTLAGTVVDSSGRPQASAAVVVFPADVATWIQHGMPPLASFAEAASVSGTFSIDVRPGEYFAAAIDEARLSDWRREATVRALAGQASRVTITRGDNALPTLRVIAIRTP